MSSIGEPPSLHSECVCRSPRNAARSSAPPRVSGPSAFSCNASKYDGVSPLSASATTPAVTFPMPASSSSVPSSYRRLNSPAGSPASVVAALRKARTRYDGSRVRSSRNPIWLSASMAARAPESAGRASTSTTLPSSTGEAARVTPSPRPQVRAATVKRMQRAAADIATESLARMEATLPWFAAMSPNQRSWIGLVAQAGVASFAEWLAHPHAGHDITGGVFATAPRELARAVTLQQTVELVRIACDTVEDHAHDLSASGDEDQLHRAVLR